MNETESKSVDILGLKPYGEAVKVATQGVVDGAGAFLGRICLPGAEEFGLLVRDRINQWRTLQAARVAQRSERKLEAIPGSENYQAHPRVVGKIVEQGSWADSDEIQEMWAGLLTSACTAEGDDDSNIIFIELLSQLTRPQAMLLSFACEKSKKRLTWYGGVTADPTLSVTIAEIRQITGVEDLHRLDREIDHLRVLGLLHLQSGFEPRLRMEPQSLGPDSTIGDISPSDLGLQMFVRCQGSRLTPGEYFKLAQDAKFDMSD